MPGTALHQKFRKKARLEKIVPRFGKHGVHAGHHGALPPIGNNKIFLDFSILFGHFKKHMLTVIHVRQIV